MRINYTLLVFTNSVLLCAKSPSHCLFNSNIFSLQGKPMEYFFHPESLHAISQLEMGRKKTLQLCAKDTGAIFTARVIKTKFEFAEMIAVYTIDNMNVTNSDTAAYEVHSVLEEMMVEQNQKIFHMIDDLKTTRNIQKIKHLKEAFTLYYHQLEDCVFQLLETTPKEKYQYESFYLSLALKNYLSTLESQYPDRIWVSYHNFLSAHVIGNREQFFSLLDDFFSAALQNEHNMVLVSLIQKNESAIAEITILYQPQSNVEFSEEFIDFKINETDLLAKKAGCTVKRYEVPGAGTKLVITYDALAGYHLFDNQQ